MVLPVLNFGVHCFGDLDLLSLEGPGLGSVDVSECWWDRDDDERFVLLCDELSSPRDRDTDRLLP